VAISPYIRNLRATIGHTLLLLPSVAVLPRRPDGRLLLVQNIETALWQTIGGAIEPDESPRDAATREALEEAGVTVELTRLLDVLGGPEFRINYPNGDMTAYVSAVFEAVVTSGTPRPDGDETSAAAWWAPEELEELPMDTLTRALLRSVSMIPARRQGPAGPPPAQ
jgi:8-oxo-dGTP pyrophosphatase MutT (NUDIX family)